MRVAVAESGRVSLGFACMQGRRSGGRGMPNFVLGFECGKSGLDVWLYANGAALTIIFKFGSDVLLPDAFTLCKPQLISCVGGT